MEESLSIGYDSGDSDSININLQIGDLGVARDVHAVRGSREIFNVSGDLEKLLEDQENELDQMKEMVRRKQDYIRHMQNKQK